MPIQYKIDVIAALKEAGYNTTRIRKEKIMGEAMLQKIRILGYIRDDLQPFRLPAWGFAGIRQRSSENAG